MNKTKKRDYGRENAHRYARICIKESGCIPIDIFKSKIIDNEDNKDNEDNEDNEEIIKELNLYLNGDIVRNFPEKYFLNPLNKITKYNQLKSIKKREESEMS